MSKENKKQTSEVEQSVGEVLTTTERFIEKNQKTLILGVVALVVLILAVLAYRNLYQKPRQVEASNAIYKAQNYFARDSFQLALKGNAEFLGFEQIISDYGSTESGNLANAYAGICEYKLGNYEKAIDLLSDYETDDNYFDTSIDGLIGDCYAELKQNDKAQKYYKKAISDENDIAPIYLKKSGVLYEIAGQKEKALEQYEEIKEEYPRSAEARDIDKYIARVQS